MSQPPQQGRDAGGRDRGTILGKEIRGDGMADEAFEFPMRNYLGNLHTHRTSERIGTFVLRTAGRWELRFATGGFEGNLGRYPLSVVSADRHGCHVTIHDVQDPNIRGEFDLPVTTAEQILMKLSMCKLGVRSLPTRPWPMAEVKRREPLLHLVNRIAAPLTDTFRRSLGKWAPNHQIAKHADEAATTDLWANVYGLVSCPPQLEPVSRQKVLEQVGNLVRRKPPPEELTSAEANAAVLTLFTLSEIELLSWRFLLEHDDADLARTLLDAHKVLIDSGVPYLDPEMAHNSARRSRILDDLTTLSDARGRVFEAGSISLLSTVAASDVVFLPPSVRAPTNPQDLSTWWVQVPDRPLPVTLNSLLSQSALRKQLHPAQPSIIRAQEDSATPRQQATPGVSADATAATASTLDDLLVQLDALTGLAPVKADVRQLINIVRVEQMRRAAGLPVTPVSRHLVFTGNPGTGKTTVARLLGQLYSAIGVLRTGQLIEASRSDLVAGYVGQTAIKTTEVVDRALGGVLFIDEAYALTRVGGLGHDFGQEAVDTLVKLMEDHRDELVVIVAGYGDEMANFISSNPGLPSRFPRTIQFPDYSADELVSIFVGMCHQGKYEAAEDILSGLRHHLSGLPRTREFGNARLVRNIFEAALARQASRIIETASSDLTRLMFADLGLPTVEKPDQVAAHTQTGPYL
jgi:Holliday junction resolvasome RuvABC ATP-dependent DNA helicase subunit